MEKLDRRGITYLYLFSCIFAQKLFLYEIARKLLPNIGSLVAVARKVFKSEDTWKDL